MRTLGETNHISRLAGLSAFSPRGAAEFERYRGKAYESLEPINCIQHLMELLN